MTGKSGEDTIIEVPVGTQIYDLKNNTLVCDLLVPDEKIVVFRMRMLRRDVGVGPAAAGEGVGLVVEQSEH